MNTIVIFTVVFGKRQKQPRKEASDIRWAYIEMIIAGLATIWMHPTMNWHTYGPTV